VAEARTFGLESERDLVRFASLTVWIGAKPEGSPDMDWVRTILSDQRISGPSRRLEIVFERILGGQEIAARNRFAEAEFLAGAI
jgi:hypothetical protein